MTVTTRKVLVDLMKDEGSDLLDDPRRTRGFLKDLLVGRPKESFWLLTALQAGVVAELRRPPSSLPISILIDNLSQRLHDQSGLPNRAAKWAIESWAIALGAITYEVESIEEPAPSVADGEQVMLVSPIGFASFRTIAEAVAAAEPGTIIQIAPGTYPESLVIEQDIELVGEGSLGDAVVESPKRSAVVWRAEGGSLRNLVVRSAASTSPSVLIEDGRPSVDRCRFEGPRGVYVTGHAAPTVVDCMFLTTDTAVEVDEEAAGTIERNSCVGQENAAIVIRGRAHPLVQGNEICDGGNEAILCLDDAKGNLVDNRISGVRGAGIVFRDRALSATRANCIEASGGPGVLVEGSARGEFEDDRVVGCGQAGVRITGDAAPVFRRLCICDNHGVGVWVSGNGRGVWESCHIERNQKSGIVVGGGNPRFVDCRATENGDSGIFVYGDGRGTFERNQVRANKNNGVAIRDDANPTLRDTGIYGNGTAGVLICAGGKGRLDGSTIEANQGSGVVVVASGAPEIRDCTIRGNGDFGVQLDQTAGGAITGCVIVSNASGAWLILPGCRTRRSGNRES